MINSKDSMALKDSITRDYPFLRDYQEKAVKMALDAIHDPICRPVINMPTGAGKSWVIAALAKELSLRGRVIILQHRQELISQNEKAVTSYWTGSDIGVYSAGLNRKETGHTVTIASINSIYQRENDFAVIIVDEAHLIPTSDASMYRTFISKNPASVVIGLTATPYRLGKGRLDEGDDRLFTKIILPVTITELQKRGVLAFLRTKATHTIYDTRDIKITQGDFQTSDLERHLSTEAYNRAVARETARAIVRFSRHHILCFCSSVRHAVEMAEALSEEGISAMPLTGDTPRAEREARIYAFKEGILTALVTVSVLTTGFDAPETDLILMCRPTLSPALYVQMLGRGMRPKQGPNKDCLVLDFAGNASRHGAVADVSGGKRREKGTGLAPMKTCPACLSLVPASAHICPDCGHEFKIKRCLKSFTIYGGDINGGLPVIAPFRGWYWRVHTSAKGNRTLRVDISTPMKDSINLFLHVLGDMKGGAIFASSWNHLIRLYRDAWEHCQRTGKNPPTWDELLGDGVWDNARGPIKNYDIKPLRAFIERWAKPEAVIVEKKGKWWGLIDFIFHTEWDEMKREEEEQNEIRKSL